MLVDLRRILLTHALAFPLVIFLPQKKFLRYEHEQALGET